MLMQNSLPTRGLNVLVVEDESLVLFHLEDMLTAMGCVIVGPAMRLQQAKDLVEVTTDLDVAILDVNLGGQPIYPVAETLRNRDVQIVFATGYGRQGLPEQWQDFPVLMKPYTADEVERVLLGIVADRG